MSSSNVWKPHFILVYVKAAIFVSCNPQSSKQCCSNPTIHLVYCLPHCSEEFHLYSQPTTYSQLHGIGQILHLEYQLRIPILPVIHSSSAFITVQTHQVVVQFNMQAAISVPQTGFYQQCSSKELHQASVRN